MALNESTKDAYDYEEENYSVEEMQCLMDKLEWEQARMRGEMERSCPPHFDTLSCWPSVREGVVATIPCFSELRGVAYDSSKSAHLACLSTEVSWPRWNNKSDYSACIPLQNSPEEVPPFPEVSHSHSLSVIYFTGYSVSLVALLTAVVIFFYFKEMRCLRNRIHANLFLTFILANSCWIVIAIMQSFHFLSSSVEFSWCVSLIFLRYFHLATFFWMFVEGLYLFLQVIATFSVEDSGMKFRHYLLLGWGTPLVVVTLWAVCTQSKVVERRRQQIAANSSQVQQPGCPFLEHTNLEWIYVGPVLLLLAANTLILISIFSVVVAKLRSRDQGEPTDHQNWKAAKALLVIIPLLGITYIITIVGPTDTTSLQYAIFEHIRAILLSTQGFTVTLPYCFLNTEVKSIIQNSFTRWRNVRHVEHTYSRGHSARNSISLAGYYACDSNSTFLSTSRRNSFLRLHAQYLSGSQMSRNQESQLVTSVILDRNSTATVPSSNLIPSIQEELTASSPSGSRSPNQVSPIPTIPLQSRIRITISGSSNDLHACSPELNSYKETPEASLLTVKESSVSCGSVHSAPCDTTRHSLIDIGDSEEKKEKTQSLVHLDSPFVNSKHSINTSPLPPIRSEMPDILNFYSPTREVSPPRAPE